MRANPFFASALLALSIGLNRQHQADKPRYAAAHLLQYIPLWTLSFLRMHSHIEIEGAIGMGCDLVVESGRC
jgi:hypothetical protein